MPPFSERLCLCQDRGVTFSDLSTAVRRHWRIAIAVFTVIVAVGVAAAILPGKRYESSSVLLVAPTSKQALSFGAVEAIQYLLPPVRSAVASARFEEKVREQLPPSIADADLSFSTDNDPGTAILTLNVQGTSRAAAQLAATAAARELEAHPISDLIQISVLSPAGEAQSLYVKRAAPIILGSIILGLIAAVFAALAAQALRGRVPGRELIRERFGLETLGEVPAKSPFPLSAPGLFEAGWPPELIDAYQRLRANVEIVLPQPAVVAVTSWSEQEGKTTVTANLAWAMASLGRRVVAVDCDLRQPALHRVLGQPSEAGIAELAAGMHVDDVLQETGLPSLQIVSSGEPVSHPAQLINSALPKLLAGLSGVTVLIDTPPIFTAETTMIVSAADAVIVVVDARGNTPSELETVLGELRHPGVRVLGLVLNRSETVRGSTPGYLYYGTPST